MKKKISTLSLSLSLSLLPYVFPAATHAHQTGTDTIVFQQSTSSPSFDGRFIFTLNTFTGQIRHCQVRRDNSADCSVLLGEYEQIPDGTVERFRFATLHRPAGHVIRVNQASGGLVSCTLQGCVTLDLRNIERKPWNHRETKC